MFLIVFLTEQFQPSHSTACTRQTRFPSLSFLHLHGGSRSPNYILSVYGTVFVCVLPFQAGLRSLLGPIWRSFGQLLWWLYCDVRHVIDGLYYDMCTCTYVCLCAQCACVLLFASMYVVSLFLCSSVPLSVCQSILPSGPSVWSSVCQYVSVWLAGCQLV